MSEPTSFKNSYVCPECYCADGWKTVDAVLAAATPPVIAATGYTILPDSSMTTDVDAISGGGTEAGLKVEIIGFPLGARIS